MRFSESVDRGTGQWTTDQCTCPRAGFSTGSLLGGKFLLSAVSRLVATVRYDYRLLGSAKQTLIDKQTNAFRHVHV